MEEALQVTNLAAAAFYAAIVVLMALEVRRLHRPIPWLAVLLVAYFAVRVLDLLAAPDPLLGYSPALDAVTDVALMLLLAFVLFHARRLVRASLAVVGEARLRLAEYERARHDYAVMVHAKVAQPIGVILGATQSIQANLDDPAARERLGAILDEASQALRTVTEELEALRSERSGSIPSGEA